jgi:hypothetical protein
VAGDIEAVFNGDWHTGKRTVAAGGCVKQLDEGAELRIQSLDAFLVHAEQFFGRDFATPERIALLFEGPVHHT